jgi:hypothetical protein
MRRQPLQRQSPVAEGSLRPQSPATWQTHDVPTQTAHGHNQMSNLRGRVDDVSAHK